MKTFKTSEGEVFTEQELIHQFNENLGPAEFSDILDILSLEIGEQIYSGTEWVKRIK